MRIAIHFPWQIVLPLQLLHLFDQADVLVSQYAQIIFQRTVNLNLPIIILGVGRLQRYLALKMIKLRIQSDNLRS